VFNVRIAGGRMINDKLFESQDFILTAIDFDKDPEIDSLYSLNLRYARYWCDSLIKPLSKNEMKKKYEKIEKKVDEGGRVVHFAIRTKTDLHLIGYMRINILWSLGAGWLVTAIGDPEHYGKAEEQIIPLALNYAFRELNLYRIEFDLPEYEGEKSNILIVNGFTLDAVNREVIYFDNRFWNELLFGILKPEWEALQEVKA
jgi:RimJ/RimL family protein N-acetyltransferase